MSCDSKNILHWNFYFSMNFMGKLNFGEKKIMPRELLHRKKKKKINLLVAHGIVS